MDPRQLDRFFRVLAKGVASPVTVILTGAGAGVLWGHVRPSLDVDFAVRLARRSDAAWKQFERAAQTASKLTGLAVNYAEDIDRWGSITLLDYQRHTHLVRHIGQLTVRTLDPAYWTIGKLSRYLDPDVQDLVAVLKRKRIPSARLIRLWARALRRSPRSLACTQFRDHVQDFLKTYGRRLWGKTFDAEEAIRAFLRQARLHEG